LPAKTHKPTQKRLREARQRGDVIRSRELATLGGYLAVWTLLGLATGYFLRHVSNVVERALVAAGSASPGGLQQPWLPAIQDMVYEVFWILGPLLSGYIALSAGISAIQTRGAFSWAPLKPSLARINPGQGLSSLLSLRSLLELGRMLLKTALLMGILGYAVALSLDSIVKLIDAPAPELLGLAATLVWRLMGLAVIAYVVGAALDYAMQFYQFMRRQRMSIQELRQDYQETEGNPRIKSQRRVLAQETLTTANLSRVTDATLVVVELNRVAVALQYTSSTPLPRVITRGYDALATSILKHARASGVPVLQDPTLARKLASVPLEHYIGEDLIDPVAAAIRWARQVDRRQF
jgi:type III secretion protein U